MAIEDIRKMLESDRATFDERVQSVRAQTFPKKAQQASMFLGVQEDCFTKGNITAAVGDHDSGHHSSRLVGCSDVRR